MKVLFIHQNMPGQYRYLAAHLAQRRDVQVAFMTRRKDVQLTGVKRIVYDLAQEPSPQTHRYLRLAEKGVLHGEAVARRLLAAKKGGDRPDIIVGHPGWGELLYVKEVYPDVPVLGFFEFFYRPRDSDIDFGDREPSYDLMYRVRTKNTINLLSLDLVDAGVSPTFFQYETYPEAYRYKLSVIFDGVDTSRCHPDPDARLALADGGELTTDDEVVTFCTRAYEEQRGFTTFMHAVAELQRQRPNLHAVIVGGQGNPYGDRAKAGETLKDRLIAETGVDLARTHFLGNVPWSRLQTVFRVSSVHIYLTVPFVLSWSLMEAMASACAVVASNTAPVREVIEDGVNGRLADFYAPAAFVVRCNEILDAPDHAADLRRRARATVLARYDLQLCLKRQVALIERLVAGERPAPPRPVHQPGAPAFMPPSNLDAPET